MHVLRALLFLRLTTLRNALHRMLRRLRQPKYLFGAIAAVAYFWFFFISSALKNGKGSGPNKIFDNLAGSGHIELIVAIVLTLFIAMIWLTPSDRPGLAFSEAEVAFLFPAPLARRQLIHYKLIDGLIMSLIGAIFFTLIAGSLRSGPWDALRKLGAWWSMNANITFHQTLAALVIARLSEFGVRTVLRRTLIIGGVVALLAVVATISIQSGPETMAWMLWPAKLAVGPFLASNPGNYVIALLPAVGLVAVQYFFIHRLETPFEEASIALAQKRGERISRMKEGKGLRFGGKAKAKRGPFPLSARLPVEAAFLWKNLMAAPSYLNRQVFFGAAGLIFVSLTWLKSQPEIDGHKIATAFAIIALVLLAYLLIFGPQLARNDLRGDIINADMLKAYPLPGWRIVLGSMLAPTVILTGIAWLLLFAAVLGVSPNPGKALWLTPQLKIVAALALALIMPTLCAVQLLVPNAATLIFPAWSQTTRNMGGGMEVMGQRLIFFAGQFVCLILALLPALILGGGTIFLTQWLIGLSAAIALAVIPVVGVFALELWLGVRFLGPRFERLDISDELRP